MLLEKETTPVFYKLNVPIHGARNLSLEFHGTHRIDSRGKDLKGCTYSVNGRSYRDVESLWQEPVEDLSENVQITRDAYGGKVIKTYKQIPTFDSGDREWDSKELEFLFFDGKNIHLLVMRGGYRIARLTFYETLLSADAGLIPVFEMLGWPLSCVRWI